MWSQLEGAHGVKMEAFSRKILSLNEGMTPESVSCGHFRNIALILWADTSSTTTTSTIPFTVAPLLHSYWPATSHQSAYKHPFESDTKLFLVSTSCHV